jgi:hypothetical protein
MSVASAVTILQATNHWFRFMEKRALSRRTSNVSFLSQSISLQRCEAITAFVDDSYLAGWMDISLSGVLDDQELWGGMQQRH